MSNNNVAAGFFKTGLVLGVIALMAGAAYYVFKGTASIGEVKPTAIALDQKGIAGKGIQRAESSTVTSSSSSVTVYQSKTITATIAPADATDKGIEWVSSDPTKVTLSSSETVSGGTNSVQMIEPFTGSVTVTAYSHYDKTIKAVCTVTNYNEEISGDCYESTISAIGYSAGSDTKTEQTYACGESYAPSTSKTLAVSDGLGETGKVDRANHVIEGIVADPTANAAGTGTNRHEVDFVLSIVVTGLYKAVDLTCLDSWDFDFYDIGTSDSWSNGTTYANLDKAVPGKDGGKAVSFAQNEGKTGKPDYSVAFAVSARKAVEIRYKFTFDSPDDFAGISSISLGFGDLRQTWTVKQMTAATSSGITDKAIEF